MKFNQPMYNPMSFKPPSAADQASNMMGQASNTFGRMGQGKKTTTEGPGKTAGGGLSSAASMGMAGYMMAGAQAGGMTGLQGMAIGAAVGLGAYLFS